LLLVGLLFASFFCFNTLQDRMTTASNC